MARQSVWLWPRSVVDAVRRVRSVAEDMVSRGGVALAVSLDVANAFNAIP